MATWQAIEFNFRRALGQAERLDAIAARLDRLSAGDFGGALQSLSAAWKGDNAGLYLSKGSALQGKMGGTATELRCVARDIRTAARHIYDAEMAALEIALSRRY